jgi:uncharacterized protein YkwD
MKNYFLHFLIIVSLLLVSFLTGSICKQAEGAAQTNWSDSMYKQYNHSTFLSYSPANQAIDFKNIDYELLCAAIFYATNNERVNATTSSPGSGGSPLNLKPFEYSQYLKYAAQMHAYDMVVNNFFAHENPYDSKKKTPFDRMALCYVTGGMRAENIADVFGIAYQAGSSFIPPSNGSTVFVDAATKKNIPPHTYNSFSKALLYDWMHSTGHRANILQKNLLYLGCGATFYNDPASYGMQKFKCVQNFGSIAPQNKY